MRLLKITALIPTIFCGYILLFIVGSTIHFGNLPQYGITPDPTSTFPKWLLETNSLGLLFIGVLFLLSPVIFLGLSIYKWELLKPRLKYWTIVYVLGLLFFLLLKSTTYFEWLID